MNLFRSMNPSAFNPDYAMSVKTNHFFGVLSDNSGESDGLVPVDILNHPLPVLPLRGLVVFPGIAVPIPIGRESSLKLAEDAAENQSYIFLAVQRDPEVEEPKAADLERIGAIARVFKVIDLPDGTKTAFVSTYMRGFMTKVVGHKPYTRAMIDPYPEDVPTPDNTEMKILIEEVAKAYKKLLDEIGENETREIRYAISQMENPMKVINFICTNVPAPLDVRMNLLATDSMKGRASQLLAVISHAIEETEIRNEIVSATRDDMTRQQREQFLQQQIRTIQEELGADDDDFEKLSAQAAGKNWDDEQTKAFDKELRKLQRFNPTTPDYAIQYSYLETMLALPWKNMADENFSLDHVQEVLDKDHYGLDKVKERIVEQMAVLKLRSDMKAPILCLYGPPGVGKTSLGKSVADALGREYCRVSLGGLHDEAEIRGHRRTYIGALPGRIISALAKCKTNNPVFVLDEIDKIGKDFKGDPSTALLEVLDPEQNNKFHDNYLDIDYDLSKVLFLATANDLSTISRPLLDRMEIIEIPGYVQEEKVQIALHHLIRKSIENHGLGEYKIEFTPEAIDTIVEGYTRESGVRQLEKKISKVLRKLARLAASDKELPPIISGQVVKDLLGPEEVDHDMYENNDVPGVVTGLAWTQAGGEILFIESSLSPGKGEKLTLTGNLGEVMKESAVLAMQYLKSNAQDIGIKQEDFTTHDVHIHVPEGAVPKDGPSAGITMATSLASSFTGRKVRAKLAMTGEITLRGKVLPVGGIQEKILAAKRAGITDIMLCSRNRKDVEEIKSEYLEGLTFHYVDRISEVLDFALMDAEK